MNSRKRRLVIPINIGVTRSDRMKTNLGKASAIFNWHQPPGADYPYMQVCEYANMHNASMHACKYAHICKYASMQVWKNACMHVYASMQTIMKCT